MGLRRLLPLAICAAAAASNLLVVYTSALPPLHVTPERLAASVAL